MTFYEPGSSLNLDFCLEEYERLREEHWSGKPGLEEFLPLVDRLANFLLRGASELTPSSGVFAAGGYRWDEIRWLTDEDHPVAEIAVERLEIDIAREFSLGTRAMAERSLDLARMVILAEPNESVMRFLRRLSRCYIAGFFPECVILCRGVLENALVDRYRHSNIPLPATEEGISSMKARIETAKTFGWLSPRAAEDARLIWKRGSKAAHEDPLATKDVLSTVQMTMNVLLELYE